MTALSECLSETDVKNENACCQDFCSKFGCCDFALINKNCPPSFSVLQIMMAMRLLAAAAAAAKFSSFTPPARNFVENKQAART